MLHALRSLYVLALIRRLHVCLVRVRLFVLPACMHESYRCSRGCSDGGYCQVSDKQVNVCVCDFAQRLQTKTLERTKMTVFATS